MIPSDTPLGLPNCGVVAVATLTGSSYSETEVLFRKHCNKKGNWRGRTTPPERQRVLRLLGVSVPRSYSDTRTNLRRWLSDVYDPAYTYEVTITGHAVAIKNGLLFDQSHGEGVLPHESPYLRKFVRSWVCVSS